MVQDADAARTLYRRVFEKNGRFAALSAYGIGRLALVAEPSSLPEAAHWFKLAASGGHVESQYNYGLALIEGWAGEVDVASGLSWLEKARDCGMADADEVYQRVTRQLADGLTDPAYER
ncbi:MAG: sel1 repeat family protein [Gammaproteobacteria bacterium]|nr:sel1 repeat family protein [Gammaproteobacteria bacterium]